MKAEILSYSWFDDFLLGELSFKCICGKTLEVDVYDTQEDALECPECGRIFHIRTVFKIEEIKKNG